MVQSHLKPRLCQAGLVLALLALALSPTAGAVKAHYTLRLSGAGARAGEPTISQDRRFSRYVAFTVGAPGATQVYLVKRASPFGATGTPWRKGSTVLASSGGPAPNGPSWSPSLSGTESGKPRCLAFASAASNLVAGDTNGTPDVFMRGLTTGNLRRFPAPAGLTTVAVDGACQRLVYLAGGIVYSRRVGGGPVNSVSGAGASDLVLATDGSLLAYARAGSVMVLRLGGGVRRVGPGSHPALDGRGRYVVWQQGQRILRATVRGRGKSQLGRGGQPTLTSGGHFVAWVSGRHVRLNVKRKAIASCRHGRATAPAISPHGNYLTYACSGGGAYLVYLGGQ